MNKFFNIGKEFATKGTFVKTIYYYKGREIDKDLVMLVSGAHYWEMCTRECITAAGIEIRETEYSVLVATTLCDYTGPGLPNFEWEEGGSVYFRKVYGNRPAGFQLRARVADKVGKIVVLHEWERRNFYCVGYGPKHKPIFSDWEKIELDGKSFRTLVW